MTKRSEQTEFISGVTPREQTVLLALGMRLTNREIAELLHISRRTVESHVASLLRKLSVSSRQDLIELTSSLRYSDGELQTVIPLAGPSGDGRRDDGHARKPVPQRSEPAKSSATARQEQAAWMNRTEELFRLAFDHAPIGMQLVTIAPDGRWTIVRANAAMAALFGEEPAALVGRVLDGFSRTHPSSDGPVDLPIGAAEHFGAEQRMDVDRVDGTTFVAEVRAATVGHPEDNDALALIRVVEMSAERALPRDDRSAVRP